MEAECKGAAKKAATQIKTLKAELKKEGNKSVELKKVKAQAAQDAKFAAAKLEKVKVDAAVAASKAGDELKRV